MNLKIVIVLSLILLVGAVLRFSLLDRYPPGVTGDEIQQGYSAYSLLLTGRDEWGDVWPIFPISFGDFRPPLYTYLTIPSIGLFGLNIIATRLPSALFGFLSIGVMYLLVRRLFEKEVIAWLASGILAISTWHVFYSRTAWESNVGLFFFLLALYLFLKGMEQGKWLIFSAVSFGLTIFCYYSFRVFTPIFVIGLLFLNRQYFTQKLRRWVICFILIIGVLSLSAFWGDVFLGAGTRAQDAAIFNLEIISQLRDRQVADPLPQPWGRVINNKLSFLLTQFSQNYLGYFSTTFYASPSRSDSSLYNLPGSWLLSVWEVLFVLVAVVGLIRKPQPQGNLLFLWLVLAPIPAALTRNYMHVQRVEVMLAVFPILSAVGIYYFYKNVLSNRNFRMVFLIGLSVVMVYSLVVRIDHYLFHQFRQDLGGLHYGYDQIVRYTEENKDKYDAVIFTKEHSEPQAFVAFYSQLDPGVYQSYSKDWKGFMSQGFKFLDQTDYKLDKYYFKNIDWNRDKLLKNTLIIGSDKEIPDGVKPLKTISDPFGKVLFKIIDTNNEN